jgi:hypothetical protein
MKPAFWVGDYVRVKGDTSPGNNRPPDGYAFIKKVRGHGAATLSSIQMVEIMENCAGRYVKMTQRVGLRFAEHQAMQQKKAVDAAAAAAGRI